MQKSKSRHTVMVKMCTRTYMCIKDRELKTFHQLSFKLILKTNSSSIDLQTAGYIVRFNSCSCIVFISCNPILPRINPLHNVLL